VVGGRIRKTMIDGVPYELGASDVGGNYGRVIDAARRVNVGLSPDPIAIGEMSFSIGGRLLRAADWADSAANLTVGDERNVLPHVLETASTFRLNPFGENVGAWLEPAAAPLDVPAAAYLRAQGVSSAAIALIDIATDYTSLAETSMLSIFRDNARARRCMDQAVFRVRGLLAGRSVCRRRWRRVLLTRSGSERLSRRLTAHRAASRCDARMVRASRRTPRSARSRSAR